MNKFIENPIIDAHKNGGNAARQDFDNAGQEAAGRYPGLEDNDAFTAYLAGYLGEMQRILAEERSSAILAEHKSNEANEVRVRVDPVTWRRLVAKAAAQCQTHSSLAKELLEDALAEADQVERALER